MDTCLVRTLDQSQLRIPWDEDTLPKSGSFQGLGVSTCILEDSTILYSVCTPYKHALYPLWRYECSLSSLPQGIVKWLWDGILTKIRTMLKSLTKCLSSLQKHMKFSLIVSVLVMNTYLTSFKVKICVELEMAWGWYLEHSLSTNVLWRTYHLWTDTALVYTVVLATKWHPRKWNPLFLMDCHN